jgi:hypothetical protein
MNARMRVCTAAAKMQLKASAERAFNELVTSTHAPAPLEAGVLYYQFKNLNHLVHGSHQRLGSSKL